MGVLMTDTSVAAARTTKNDLRVSSIISRSGGVLSRHFLKFFIVAVIAYSPPTLLIASTQTIEPSEALSRALWAFLGVVLLMVVSQFGDAIILHAAFRDMRRRPVRLVESLNVVLGRFLPLIGIAFVQGFLILLGTVLLIIPGLILSTIWFVGVPGCVVERRGPLDSLGRSRELTKGSRWKVSALALLLPVVSLGASPIESALTALAGPIVGLTGQLIWTGIAAAFSAVVISVTYHDLRVIKEGIDIEQITAVFD
jgi:hypothetical protein